tara:strand:- start:2196 stop:2585 length:390 start_codon:yes stop_codon:yes gene_type:complete
MYENLIKAIVEQSNIESLSELKEFLEEIAIHGCASYAPYGFTYYSENVEFHAKHEDELWDILHELSEDFGHPSIIDFIASCNVHEVNSHAQLANAIVWICLEHIASLYLNDAINFERDDDLADLFKVAS